MNSLWDIRIFLGLLPKESHCMCGSSEWNLLRVTPLNFQVASRFLENLCAPVSSYTDDRMVRWIIVNHENGSGRGLIGCLDRLKKNTVRTGDLRAKIWTWNLQHTKQEFHPNERDGTDLTAPYSPASPFVQNTSPNVLHFRASPLLSSVSVVSSSTIRRV